MPDPIPTTTPPPSAPAIDPFVASMLAAANRVLRPGWKNLQNKPTAPVELPPTPRAPRQMTVAEFSDMQVDPAVAHPAAPALSPGAPPQAHPVARTTPAQTTAVIPAPAAPAPSAQPRVAVKPPAPPAPQPAPIIVQVSTSGPASRPCTNQSRRRFHCQPRRRPKGGIPDRSIRG